MGQANGGGVHPSNEVQVPGLYPTVDHVHVDAGQYGSIFCCYRLNRFQTLSAPDWGLILTTGNDQLTDLDSDLDSCSPFHRISDL